MSDPLKDNSQFHSEGEIPATSFSNARFYPTSDILQSIQPGNVRRLVEKFRRLGEQTILNKPFHHSSCARKIPGSLCDGHAQRSVSFRRKELLAARKKSDRLKKNRTEKWVLLSPCLFSPGDFVSSSVSLSNTKLINKRLSRSVSSDSNSKIVEPILQLPSIVSCEPETAQIECSTVDVLGTGNCSNDNINNDVPKIQVEDVVLAETGLDNTNSECLEGNLPSVTSNAICDLSGDDLEGKVIDSFLANEEDTKSEVQTICGSKSEISAPESSTISDKAAIVDQDKIDDADPNKCNDSVIGTLLQTDEISDEGIKVEFNETNENAEDPHEIASNCYEEIEINPELWVCRDQTFSSSQSEQESSSVNTSRTCSDSVYSVFNNSVDSVDSDLTDYDIVYRNECLSISLPAQINNRTSKRTQENIYQNVGTGVPPIRLNSSLRVSGSINDGYLNLSGIFGSRRSAKKSEDELHKVQLCEENGRESDVFGYEEYDFHSKRTEVESSRCPTDQQSYYDDEHIYEECDFSLQSFRSVSDVDPLRSPGSPSSDNLRAPLASKEDDSIGDDSRISSLSDSASCRNSDASSVYESISNCSKSKECESSEAVNEQKLVFEPLNKLERIKVELVETERKYIDRLWLLNGEFRMALMSWNEENELLPPEAFNQMFLNIDVIYRLHSVFFLPDLEDCLKPESNKRIEDVFIKNADFLKLYSEYSGNFDNARKTIEVWKSRVPEFSKMIQEIQRKPICHSLTLEHHMLEPVQRIPRYKLLLNSYLENLPKDSPEYEKAEKALVKVTAAATHCENFFESMEKFRKVLDVQQNLWNKIDLLSPSRELILSGRMRVTQQLENDEEKHLFLFSDTLLVCKRFPPGITPPYKLTLRLDVGDLQVIDRKRLGTTESFFVISRQGYLEMHPSSLEEREKWISALQTVISNFNAQETSRRRGNRVSTLNRQKSIPGRQAPIWIKDPDANRCMQCDESFNAIRRRHHCRACGIVVCGRCSNKQTPLEFDGGSQNHRVCDKCFCEIQNLADQSGTEHRTSTPANVSHITRNAGKYSSHRGQHRTSFFFVPTPAEKSQNHGQTNDGQKISLFTSSLEAIIDTGVET